MGENKARVFRWTTAFAWVWEEGERGVCSASGVGSHKRAFGLRLAGVWKPALVQVLPWNSLTASVGGR